MSSVINEDEPTIFSKNSKIGGSAFPAGSGRGTGGSYPSFETEKLPPPNEINTNRENPSLQIDDHLEQLTDTSLRVFKSNYGVALAAPIFNSLFKVIESDPRHSDFLLLRFNAVEARDFSDWSMASIEVDEQRFINIANQALHAEDVAMSAVRDFLCYGKWID